MLTTVDRETRRLLLILGGLAAFGPFSIDMYLPAFPALRESFGVSAGTVQSTLVTFFLGLSIGQVLYGPLSDRLGRRTPLLAGIGLYLAASLAAMAAPSIQWLAAARLAQGLGGCAGMVISRAVVRDRFAEHQAAAAFSTIMLVMGVAPVVAPTLGGAVLHLLSWRGIFGFLTLFGLACFISVARGLPETLPPDRRSGGDLLETLRAFAALLRHRKFMTYTLAGGLVQSCLFAYLSGSPGLFMSLKHLTPGQYSLLFGTNAAGLIAMGQVNIRLLRRFNGRRIALVANLTTLTAAAALLAVAILDPPGLLPLWLPLFVVVASGGLIFGNLAAAAMSHADRDAGAASSLMGVLQFGMGALAGAVVGVLDNGTAVPLAALITLLAGAGLIMQRIAGAASKERAAAAASGG